jgi:hypothetical protein
MPRKIKLSGLKKGVFSDRFKCHTTWNFTICTSYTEWNTEHDSGLNVFGADAEWKVGWETSRKSTTWRPWCRRKWQRCILLDRYETALWIDLHKYPVQLLCWTFGSYCCMISFAVWQKKWHMSVPEHMIYFDFQEVILLLFPSVRGA